MADWHAGDVRFLAVAQLGERYRRYRLPDPDAEAAMAGSSLSAMDNSLPWSSASARRRTRSSTVSSDWPPRGPSA